MKKTHHSQLKSGQDISTYYRVLRLPRRENKPRWAFTPREFGTKMMAVVMWS